MVEAGQAYNAANQLFLSSLSELALFQEKQGVISVRTLTSTDQDRFDGLEWTSTGGRLGPVQEID